jgi:hypothetical protein
MNIRPATDFDDAPTSNESDRLARIHMLAERLVERAAMSGIVLTIDQVALVPLAMGHYKSVVSVRLARK